MCGVRVCGVRECEEGFKADGLGSLISSLESNKEEHEKKNQ